MLGETADANKRAKNPHGVNRGATILHFPCVGRISRIEPSGTAARRSERALLVEGPRDASRAAVHKKNEALFGGAEVSMPQAQSA
jgi:hypothetical protein